MERLRYGCLTVAPRGRAPGRFPAGPAGPVPAGPVGPVPAGAWGAVTGMAGSGHG